METIKVDVVIPTYKPGKEFGELLNMLQKQTYPISRIIIINTEEEYFSKEYADFSNVEVMHIRKEDFDHAATRNKGMLLSSGDYVIFMTMDAIPSDEFLVENLIKPHLEVENIAVSYARQLPKSDCCMMEQFTRIYNYPAESMVKTIADVERLGIKTYFCSDVCAMYNRELYQKLGGFVQKAIFNEDMIYAAKAIKNNYGIAYCADAGVLHSHNYSVKQQFSRNFDMGVSQALHPEVFKDIKSEGEGVRLVKKTAGFLIKNGHWYDIPRLVIVSAAKYLGYKKGKNFKKLPETKILKYTMNKSYWKFGE